MTPVEFDEPWVALDLETTGLDSRKDKVIEIGAVKFAGDRVLDTFQTFVNPKRRLSAFIRQLTGITQSDVSGAPEFSGVAARLTEFVGPSPIVGHNVGFDLGFLEAGGVTLANPRCDTYDLAFVLLPRRRCVQPRLAGEDARRAERGSAPGGRRRRDGARSVPQA